MQLEQINKPSLVDAWSLLCCGSPCTFDCGERACFNVSSVSPFFGVLAIGWHPSASSPLISSSNNHNKPLIWASMLFIYMYSWWVHMHSGQDAKNLIRSLITCNMHACIVVDQKFQAQGLNKSPDSCYNHRCQTFNLDYLNNINYN